MDKSEISKLNKLCKIINTKVNLELLKQALTHRSYLNEFKGEHNLSHNERLEFLGDAVLELVVTEFLYHKFQDLNEGVLTSYRAALVKTDSLADESRRLNLGEFIYMSRGEEQSGGRERQYILANTFEAIIGSIYMTSGYNDCKKFIEKNICYKIEEIIDGRKDIDAKSRLQELAQETTKFTPIYELIEALGPDHNKTFEMKVLINTELFGSGKGKSKQEAEQFAAKDALDNWDILYKKYYKTKKASKNPE